MTRWTEDVVGEGSRRILSEAGAGALNIAMLSLIVVVAALLMVLVVLACSLRRTKDPLSSRGIQNGADMGKQLSVSIARNYTAGFSSSNQVGRGDFGDAFVGTGPEGQPWLIVRIDTNSREAAAAFRKEVEKMGPLKHPNLVRLAFWAEDTSNQVLAYEDMSKDTTLLHRLRLMQSDDDVLSSSERGESLTLEQRVDVATAVAEALYYLHHEANPPVVHRDLNSGNVFIGGLLRVRVGNVGAVKGLPNAPTCQRVRNTAGYLDPDYFHTFRATTSSDIYSFGVVLLELLTGQLAEAEDSKSAKKSYMNVAWVMKHIALGDLGAVLDPKLSVSVHDATVRSLASLAAACTAKSPQKRPQASAVLQELRNVRTTLSTYSAEVSSTSSSSMGRISLKDLGEVEDAVIARVPSAGLFESQFTYAELQAATRNFSIANKLGEAHLGEAFRGVLPSGSEILVTRKAGSGDSWLNQTVAAIKSMRKVQHPNLVSLLGWSVGPDVCLLVFNYLQTPNLYLQLHRPTELNLTPLTWAQRLDVAYGVAEGIAHLHDKCRPPMVHGSIASTNVLLSAKQQPQLADLRVPHFAEKQAPEVDERMRGYFGPERATFEAGSLLFPSSDVYAFGVLLFELITGQRAYHSGRSPPSLGQWARKKLWKGRESVERLIDPVLLKEGCPVEEVEALAEVALSCTLPDADRRPTIGEVIKQMDDSFAEEEGSRGSDEADSGGQEQ